MKIELEARKSFSDDLYFLELEVENGISSFKGFCTAKLDEIETLELELTNIVHQLYTFRQQHGIKQNDE